MGSLLCGCLGAVLVPWLYVRPHLQYLQYLGRWAVWKAAALNCLPQPARVRAPPLRWWMSLRGPQPQSIWETHDGLGVLISARTPEANSGCTPTSPVRFSCEGPPSTLDESLHFYFLHCYLPLSRFPAFPQSRSPDFCPAWINGCLCSLEYAPQLKIAASGMALFDTGCSGTEILLRARFSSVPPDALSYSPLWPVPTTRAVLHNGGGMGRHRCRRLYLAEKHHSGGTCNKWNSPVQHASASCCLLAGRENALPAEAAEPDKPHRTASAAIECSWLLLSSSTDFWTFSRIPECQNLSLSISQSLSPQISLYQNILTKPLLLAFTLPCSTLLPFVFTWSFLPLESHSFFLHIFISILIFI